MDPGWLRAGPAPASSNRHPGTQNTRQPHQDADTVRDPTTSFTPTYYTVGTPTPSPTATPVDPDLFYYCFDEKIFLTPSNERIGVAFLEEVGLEQRVAFIEDYEILGEFVDGVNLAMHPHRIRLTRSIPWTELKSLLDDFAEGLRVSYVTPLFAVPGGIQSGLTDTFTAKFLSHVTDQQIDDLNEIHEVIIVESGRLPHRHGSYLLKLMNVKNGLEVLDLANLYHLSDLTEYSAPNFGLWDLLFSEGQGSLDNQRGTMILSEDNCHLSLQNQP